MMFISDIIDSDDKEGVYYDPQCSRRPDQGPDNIGNKDYLDDRSKVSESPHTYHQDTLWCTDEGQGRPQHPKLQLSSDSARGIKGPRGFTTQRQKRFSEDERCRGGFEQTKKHQHGDRSVEDGCHGDDGGLRSTKTSRSRQLEMEFCRKVAQLWAEREVNVNRNAKGSSRRSTWDTSLNTKDSIKSLTRDNSVTTKKVTISIPVSMSTSTSSSTSSSESDEKEKSSSRW